ncbi:MAG: T9SS type A sorting domain-containing protein [Bacteroidetes bacterium]|nr:T9SS type A sorting domain-containing protein [Bacteroidota bacterium]
MCKFFFSNHRISVAFQNLVIRDQLGRIIFELPENQNYCQLKPGIYFLKAEQNGFIQTQKLIVQ